MPAPLPPEVGMMSTALSHHAAIFAPVVPFEDGRPVPLAAAHQQLENFTSGDFIELIGNDRRSSADGIISRQIVVCAVGEQLRPARDRNGPPQSSRIFEDGLHILRRDGAGKNISAAVVAVGAVVGKKDVELHAVESRHNERGTPGGDGQQDAVLL